MRRSTPSLRFLLVSLLVGPLASSVGCGSADPEAAAKAAKSAGGALEPLSLEPKDGEGPKLPDEPRLPGGRGDVKPPPVEAGATCITDDDPPTTSDPPSQRIPPKTPNLPNVPTGPTTPELEGVVPKAAPSGGGGTTRSRTSSSGTVVGSKLDFAALCQTKMSDQCSAFCEERGLTWDRSAGNAGTCFELTSAATSTDSTVYECGCMCK